MSPRPPPQKKKKKKNQKTLKLNTKEWILKRILVVKKYYAPSLLQIRRVGQLGFDKLF
jgi:hypothetical protein